MASQLITRFKSSSYEMLMRRNRLRKVLLETLERRELLAADLLSFDSYTSATAIAYQAQAQQLAFTSLPAGDYSGYSVTNFLDDQLGGHGEDLSQRPWFPLVEQSYEAWSRQLGLQSSILVDQGLQAEGEGGLVAEGEAGGPRLLSIAPNSGDIFTFNNTNQLTEAPTELVFRFDGSSDLDAATLRNGIRVTRAGGDGVFGNANDSVLTPGYLGFGDNNRIVVLRFSSTLQDDLYRVELIGEDNAAQGLTAIRNAAGLKLQTRIVDATPSDLTRDSVDFDLELGAQVVAVVPQPVDRVGATLTPRPDVIRVYFNDDDMYPTAVTTGAVSPNPTVVDPSFYQLILTADTVQPSDDQVFAPVSISYDPATDMAELKFSRAIDQLAGAGTFRLRIGSRDSVVSTTNPQAITPVSPADPAGDVASAFPLGTFSSAFSTVINQNVTTTSTAVLPLDFPGSNFEPGHRDIQDESHLSASDVNPGITQYFYNFALNRPYGVDATGRPVNTSITTDQIQRVREIFEFYSSILGVDFVESDTAGFTVVVGDLFPLGGTRSRPGFEIGLAGGNLAIMDGAETWDNSFGGRSGIPGAQNFFETAMHEIGHMLGYTHTYDLPPGTIMGSEGDLANPNPGLAGTEWSFPGEADIIHGQHLYRPDNRDVDTYSFVVPAGQAGRLTAETFAERLPNSSNLDTYLTLMKQRPDGGVEIIAVNNDSNSSDSFLSAELTSGTYFISVTGKGNENFDPVVPNTGSGAVSEGTYQLKLDFKPTVSAGLKFSIEDMSGTPLDGDGDGEAGGNFNFWFRAAAPVGVAAANQPKTIYVDKSFTGSQTGPSLGSPTQPLNNLDFTNPLKWPVGLLQPGDIVRVVGSTGNSTSRPAYEIGRGGVGNQVLSDGLALEVPRGVTMMIDAGAIFKLQGTRITTGSLSAAINKSMSALQVLGIPQQTVNFTSYRDESQGTDTNPLNTTPGAGDWGGIDFHEDIDRREGFGSYERQGIFLNYIANADIRYGGGPITVSTPSPTINPINLTESRPTLLNNTIRFSSDAAISADPNSFEETRFTEPRYQLAESFSPDYARVGPVIRGNTLLNNSTNGLFIKTSTVAGGPLTTLDTAARLDDTDITYVLGENLIIKGTPGGAVRETVGPDVSLVQRNGTTGGSLAAGISVRYRLTAVDLNGAEGVPSAATVSLTLAPTDNAVSLSGLPKASGDYVSRRLWRSIDGGPFRLVAELDSDTTTYKDVGTTLAGALPTVIPTAVNRARLDARLQIDPGVIIKSTGSRIEAGIGAQLIAEGTPDRPIVFTSRFDDRYGAGGTFDTNSDGTASNPGAGNWGGLVARHLSTMSIDNAIITFGGGVTSVAGGFAGFSAVEIHQAEARLANTRLEVNGSGLGGNVNSSRDGHGPNDASVIFVVGSQPVLINNTLQNNSIVNTAAISINANAMNTDNVSDAGRQTGDVTRNQAGLGNVGPLVDGNRLLGNGLNGMRIRGETLTTETIWDDTDIVHILQSEIIVPDFHTYGGLRLQSKADESLVVKLGAGAGLTATGRPLDITDRIGGSLRIVGTPGFPVVMTSINDDSVGAGFDPNGRALVDTNNNGPSIGVAGDWRSIRLDPYANDRNVDSAVELESDQIQDTGTNDVTGVAQHLGALASNLNGGDENLRLGISVDGSIAAPQDLDVYSISATAGTAIWIDIDQTNGSLDSVVELIDASGQIIAQSNNSLAESAGTESRYVTPDASKITPDRVLGLDKDPFAPTNTFLPNNDRDLYSVNPRDAGMRIILPGATGARNTYYIRVRSSNLAPGDATSKLYDPTAERQGLTTGNYRLQVRLQQTDEVPGSTIRYADIRYATNGIETRGMSANSPLLGQLAEGGAITPLGNIATSDRGSVTVSGAFDVTGIGSEDVYSFTVRRSSTQVIDPSTPTPHIATTFDIDYADGFGRPDTSLWVFNSANQLVLVGSDSNIADDRAAPGQSSDLDDLTRGSNGARDPFIGAAELPPGDYTVVVTSNSLYATALNQFQQANASNPLVRLEPINSVQRISQDRFETGTLAETASGPVQVSFANDNDNAANNQQLVQWTLADMTAFVLQSSGLLMFANPFTGAREADVSDASNSVAVGDLAMSPDGLLVASEIFSNNPIDSNTGNLLILNQTGTANSATIPVGSTVAGNSGLQTYTTQQTAAGANPTFAIQQRDHGNTQGNVPQGDGFVFNGLTYATADNQELKLFGVGSRQRGALPFNLPVLDANNAVTGILQDAASGNPVRVFNTTNVVYKLNPTTGAVINPGANPAADRTGTGLVGNHAGTQKIEFGRFLSGSANDPNGPYTEGTVTGLAQIGNTLYAVSDLGEFYAVNIGDGDASFAANETVNSGDVRYSGRRATTVVTDGGAPVAFTSLTRGPRNLEGGRYANMLFATTANGTIYALGTDGSLQPVFPGFSYKVHSTDRGGLGNNVVGFDFSPLDVNLFHLTDRRDNEAGHGRPVPFDNSQATLENGDRALYFGFEDSRVNTGAQRQQGDWSGLYDVAAYDGTYNLPGGAHGAIVSNPIDLRGYSADDLPTLYFNYFLATENANSDLDDTGRMRDAFRVYGAAEDGNWVLLATNNTPDDQALNRNNHTGNTDWDEFDNDINKNLVIDPNENYDAFGNPLQTQEAFDGAGWRQIRTSLSAFAGKENVRLRFEFSTAGSFETGDPMRGGQEMVVVSGAKLLPGSGFQVQPLDGAFGTTTNFQFDMGLVLNLPSAASLTDGVSRLTVNGVDIIFSTTDNTGNNIQYLPSDSPASLANRVRLRLPAIVPGITGIATNSLRNNVLNVTGLPDGTSATYSTSADLPEVIQSFPQAIAGVSKIPVTQDMSVAQVRDAIRTALANEFSDPANIAGTTPAQRLATWKFHDNTIQLYKYAASNNSSALGITNERFGDYFGVNSQTSTGGSVALAHMDERAQNNAHEGLYIDDIIIGFAERGEMVLSATANNTFQLNRQFPKTLYDIDQTETGRYQLTVRTAADYGTTNEVNGRLLLPFGLGRQFNTNDRLSQQVGIEVSAAAAGRIPDGATFTLSDGGKPVVFEFDVSSGFNDSASGVQPGSVPVAISTDATREEIALAIRNAINSPTVQGLLKVTASLRGEMTYGGFFGDVAPSNSTTVLLHGQIATGDDGSFTFPANTFLTGRVWGIETGFGEDLGDAERTRPQGQILLVGNTITNSSQYGIHAAAGNRDQATPTNAVGARPYPGAPINFPTPNTSQLAPGVVIVNNILAYNTAGGIRLQGESGADAPGQIARVLNNTIYGVAGADNGILIENNATPTILNNVIANTGTGVRAPAGSSAVLGANVYQSNATNTVNVGLGSFPETLAPTAPLFVDVTNRRFYLAPGSLAIDSSVEALQERPALAQVKNALGLPENPMIAPDVDVTGQRRVDDPSVNTPAGLGGNVFKDRGAVDRSDFVGLDAILLQPQDNDAQLLDVDRNTTYIQLQSGTLDFFSILLQDNNGTGPDPQSVVSGAVRLTENGRLLTEGVDYVFGYNANSRTVRLTPVAGIWRTDSVYEITLINQQSVDLKLSPGSTAVDGHAITVTHAGGSQVFELDNDGAASIAGATLVPFSSSMSAYEIASRLRLAINTAGIGVSSLIKGTDSITVSGAVSITATGASLEATNLNAITDLAGNPLFANRANALTQFTVIMPDAQLDFGDAEGAGIPVFIAPNTPPATNGNGARHVLLPVDVPQLALGSFADTDADGRPTAAADGDDTDGTAHVDLGTLGSIGGLTIGSAGPAVLSVPAAAGLIGQTFTITDTAKPPYTPVTFEFATNAVPGSVSIPVVAGDTADQVAVKVAAAVYSAVLGGQLVGLTPVASGDQISLGGSASHLIDLTAAPGVARVPAGNVQIVVPTSLANLADGQTLTVQDAYGSSVTFELNNTDPTVMATPVANGRQAININLADATTASVASAIASAIDSQIASRRLTLGKAIIGAPTSVGIPVSIIADDEDGVSFSDVFNAATNPVGVTVVSTGAGLLDAWIDWNRDGDFNDDGERLFSTSQPVQAGANVFMIQTPATAVSGFTTARFRLSALGGLLPSGVGIGGEVEDHLVEIAPGSPPVVQSDSFTTEEDLAGGLTVPRAQSILANDTDADIVAPELINPGVNIFVHDQDPLTAAVDPLVGPSHGTLTLQPDGSFTYLPNPEFSGTDTFVYNATDGRLVSRVPTTVTIVVNPVNDAPEFRIARQAASSEDAGVVVIPGFLADILPGPVDATDEASQALTVTATPVDPSVFTLFSLDADGTLTYRTRADLNSLNANFDVEVYVTDDGLAGPAPNSNRSAAQTFTIEVAPVNDEPSFELSTNEVNVIEDAQAPGLGRGETVIPGFAFNIRRGPDTATDELTQGLDSFEIISVSAPEKFSVLPAIDVATGNLSFTTAEHKNGTAVVVVRLTDQGPDSPAPNDNASILHTFTISIDPVNDAPTLTVPTELAVDEDAGLISLKGFATGMRSGPVGSDDENGQLVSFSVRALNPALFEVQPTIAVDGTLTFQTASNVNSDNAQLLVEVILTDNGPSGPSPNRNSSDPQTFSIVVNAVNDPPTTDSFTVTLDEDTPVEIQVADVLVGDVPGPTSDELSQTLRMTQVQSTSLQGGQVTPVFDPLDPNRIISLKYTPPSDLLGIDTILYVITDNGSPERSGTGIITLSISGINDPPSFNRGPAQTVTEDAPAVSVENWATGIVAGPPSAADELESQTVSFSVVADNPALFAVQPQVSSNGTLTYTLAKDANGTTNVTVIAIDSGSGVAPNSNASLPQTFAITITPVNDAPDFTVGGNLNVLEDSGSYSQVWATEVVAAAGLRTTPPTATDEASQVVDFEVSVDSPNLFSSQPRINSAGVLDFTTAPDAFGQAIVVVTAVDRGPAGTLDQPRSASRTFTISIDPVNDVPVAIGDQYATDEDSLLAIPPRGLLLNDADVDLPLDTLSVVAGTFTSDFGATVVVHADGSMSYDPQSVALFQQLTAGQSVSDTFVYKVRDAAGAESAAATVTIAIEGVDDPPVAVDDLYAIQVGIPRALDVLANDTDVDSTIDPATIVIKANPSFGTIVVQGGLITYTPGGGFRGNDSFRYTIKDATGNESNEAEVRLTVNGAPTAVNDAAFTYKGIPVDINVLGNDRDLDGSLDPASVRIETSPGASGTAVVLPSGAIRFTPASGFSGDAEFTYSVQDDSGTQSNLATVKVRVANSRWQNPQSNLDVSNDGFVSPIDALLIINYLNGNGERFLPASNVIPPPYLDTNGDEFVSATDVLNVINFLNQNSQAGRGEGEAEALATNYVQMVTPQQMLDTVGPLIVREMQTLRAESLSEVVNNTSADSAKPNLVGSDLAVIGFKPAANRDDELVALLSSDPEPIKTSIDDAIGELFGEI